MLLLGLNGVLGIIKNTEHKHIAHHFFENLASKNKIIIS